MCQNVLLCTKRFIFRFFFSFSFFIFSFSSVLGDLSTVIMCILMDSYIVSLKEQKKSLYIYVCTHSYWCIYYIPHVGIYANL